MAELGGVLDLTSLSPSATLTVSDRERGTDMESSTGPIIATITVPMTFWADHSWRTREEYPVGTVIKEGKRTATVAFTQEEWDNFYSDADYYADCAQHGEWSRSEDPGLWAIGQSAIRAMDAIRKHEAATA